MQAVRVARPISLIAFSALMLSPGLWLGPSLDAAVFVLAGARIRDGYMPYRDLWDHKPPGSYLLNALGQTILPWLDSWVVSWLVTVVLTGAAIVVFEGLLRRRLAPTSAFIWSLACLVLMASYPVTLGGGLTESFAILPLVAALRAVCRAEPSPRVLASIGCLLSVACLLTLQALPVAAVLFVAAVSRGGGPAALLRRVGAAVAGGAVLPLAAGGWLAAGGAMGDAVDQLVTYNAAYRNAAVEASDLVVVALLLLACLAVPSGVTIVRMVRSPRAFDRIDWSCLAWVVAYGVYVGYQGRIYLHYAILVVPPAVWLAGSGMAWLMTRANAPDQRPRPAAIGLLVAAVCGFAVSAVTVVGLYTALGRIDSDRTKTTSTAAWIEANTPASATLFVWGHDPDLYLLSDRPPYDRYVYDFPLFTDGYAPADHLAALLADWTASSPQVIVESTAAAPLLRAPEPGVEVPSYPVLGSIRDFVRSRYRLAAAFDDYEVYVLTVGS
jgi:hypothetical protein